MIRTIFWFMYFWLYLFYLQPTLHKVQRLKNKGEIREHDRLTSQVAQKWARSLVKFAGAHVKTMGEENIPHSGPVLFVSNHQGNFDIPLLLGYIEKPKGFIAKIELQKFPLIRSWMPHINCVFIDRSDIRQSLKVINEAAELLKAGYSMVIFPEGTRSKKSSLGEFKHGSLKLAIKAQVPVVPITIVDSYRILEEKGNIKPAEVKIIIHKPLYTQNMTKDQAANLAEYVRQIIKAGLDN